VKSKLAWLGGAIAIALGVVAAVAVSGAAAGPNERVITIFGQGRTLTLAGSPEAELLTISGVQSECCITIDGTDFSADDDRCQSGSGTPSATCDLSHVKSMTINLAGGEDRVNIADRFSVLTVRGGTETDNLFGGKGPETLNGDGGDDNIDGRGGGDSINGGQGKDTCKGSRKAEIKKCE
jgi:Ca2+-binding RTX toxin-like protein